MMTLQETLWATRLLTSLSICNEALPWSIQYFKTFLILNITNKTNYML